MPVKVKEMSSTELRRLNEPGKYSVGGVPGLQIEVKDTGSKSWVLRTMVGSVRRNIGLGGFPEVPLAQAREKAREMKEMIRKGVDPVAIRRTQRLDILKSQAKHLTFADAARLCHEKKISEFRNAKHAKDWLSSVKRYAIPVIGSIPVSTIELTHILKVLDPIWTSKTETATRTRQRIEAILAWATVSGYREGDNPARWTGNLDAVLPKPGKIKKVEHFKALPWQEVGSFMKALRKKKGIAAKCLEFTILTAARSGESRLATWDEVNLEDRVWTVPADRMKIGREHRVPLSEPVVSLVSSMPRMEGSEYIFTAPRGGPLSDAIMSKICRTMKVNAVPHGFRSSFRDWCSENTNYPREVAEMALAHAIESKVEAAYRRGDLFNKRRKMMEAWAEFCSREYQAGKVVPLNVASMGRE